MAPSSQRHIERHSSKVGSLHRQRSGLQDDPQHKATIAYIKRVLCARPHSQDPTNTAGDSDGESLESLLPPLTSSNAIDIELYALIAVILSNFVQVWYNRITPDQEFVREIVQIIAHCTRELEQRLRQVDLESLVLDELPDLLIEHIHAVRISRPSRTGGHSQHDQRSRYLALRPHTALEPVPDDVGSSLAQEENEVAWCLLLVNRVLPLILPPEDLLNPCLDVLVSEIFSEMIFHNGICGKACEPWLLWDGVAKVLQSIRPESGLAQGRSANSLEASGLLSTARASQATEKRKSLRGRFDAAIQVFWLTIQTVMTLWFLLREFGMALMQARSIPPRANKMSRRMKTPDSRFEIAPDARQPPKLERQKPPIIGVKFWNLTTELLLLDKRMPWLTGMISLLQWAGLHGPGQLCSTNSALDRLASSHITNNLLSSRNLPILLRSARTALFPNNALAPARTPPTELESLQIKRDCAIAILSATPEFVRTSFFATENVDRMLEDVEEKSLDLLNDSYINKHLIVGIIDLIAVRLFPELAGGDDYDDDDNDDDDDDDGVAR